MKNRRKRSGKALRTGLLFIFLLTCPYIIWVNAIRISQQPAAGADTRSAGVAKPPAPDASEMFIPVSVTDIEDTRYLELINGDYAIGANPDPRLIVPAFPSVQVSTTDVTLHTAALDALSELFTAARGAGRGNNFYISSGYRDYDRQAQLYDEAPDRSYVQPPGHSEHHSGLAADILITGVPMAEMEAAREWRWLAGNAWKYGLILRYTDDKRGITGIAGEPWHFRYVGQPHAWYCWKHGMCFEEYIQFLRDSGGYSAEIDGENYTVLYRTPIDGIIYVPAGGDYNVSGDNTGGYIITIRE